MQEYQSRLTLNEGYVSRNHVGVKRRQGTNRRYNRPWNEDEADGNKKKELDNKRFDMDFYTTGNEAETCNTISKEMLANNIPHTCDFGCFSGYRKDEICDYVNRTRFKFDWERAEIEDERENKKEVMWKRFVSENLTNPPRLYCRHLPKDAQVQQEEDHTGAVQQRLDEVHDSMLLATKYEVDCAFLSLYNQEPLSLCSPEYFETAKAVFWSRNAEEAKANIAKENIRKNLPFDKTKTPSDLVQLFTQKELKEFCAELSITPGGKKIDVAQRLVDFL